MIPFSIRVSNKLGARRAQVVHLAIYVALFTVAIESILVAIVLILGHKLRGYFYRSEEKVVNCIREMLLFLC